jgi:hypothetical protein
MKPRKINIGGSEDQQRSAISGSNRPAGNQTVDAEAAHA